MPTDRLTGLQMEAPPAFSGYSKGYLIEARVEQLRSFHISFENERGETHARIFGPDQIASHCYRLSDRYLWIPMNPENKTPFNKDRESFIGAIYQNIYKIAFSFEFEAVQEIVRIHSIHYNLLNFMSGMACRKYNDIQLEVCDRR
jgi:hypothetical protein